MCIFFVLRKVWFFTGANFLLLGLCTLQASKKMGMVMKQTMLLLRWSNNNVIHGSQRRYFVHKTKVVRLEKRGLCNCWVYLPQSKARSSKLRPLQQRLQKQRFPKLTAMWTKGCDACKKKSVRCNRKATFHCKGKLQEVFRAGLNEIKYDDVDSKQHFYLQYHVKPQGVDAVKCTTEM